MTYTFSDSNFTLVLVLDDIGKVASVTLTLSGNDIGVSVAKEQSTVLVECFEGTWTQTVGGSDHGIWNVAIHGSRFVGGATGPDGSWAVITGTMDGLQFTVDNQEGQTWTGSLSKDRKTVSGTWEWPGASFPLFHYLPIPICHLNRSPTSWLQPPAGLSSPSPLCGR